MDAPEAVERFVQDGDQLVIGNYTVGSCAELVYEVARQKKKELTLYSQSGIFDVEVLVAAGCVERLVTTYVLRSGGRSGGSAVERALRKKILQVEDYTNFNYNARLMAGMHGFSFMQVFEGLMPTDLVKKRRFMGEDKYRTIQCPYTGKQILTVPAANPDVCIVHVQRADKKGNAQYWGALGSVAAAALASKKIIVSCEEIVDHEVVKSNPAQTIIPGFRVDAVVESPWGAHPTEVLGYYNLDRLFYGLFIEAIKTEETLNTWLDQWVFGCPNRKSYLAEYKKQFGKFGLEELKAKPYLSRKPPSYGSAFTSVWNQEGRDRLTGLTKQEIEIVLKERGMLYG